MVSILIVLLFATTALSIQSPTALQAARSLYGRPDVTIAPVGGGDFAAAFPGVTRYAVVAGDGLPGDTHTMTWDGVNGLDATRDFNALLALRGATVASAADGLKFGRALAEIANAELQPHRRVATSADSAALGLAVPDPSAGVSLGRVSVRLWTWSATNGVVADWTIVFAAGRVESASWSVVAVGRGADVLDLRATDLRVGHAFTNAYTGSAHAVSGTYGASPVSLPGDPIAWDEIMEARRTNFDGSVWVVNYPAAISPPVSNAVTDAAREAAEAGVFAYGKQVSWNRAVDCGGARWNPSATNWSFEHTDEDCILEIRMGDWYALRCIACASGDTIWVSPAIKETLNALGYYLDLDVHTLRRVMRQVVGHEHFHSLQFDMGLYGHAFFMEGTARFQQTLLEAVTEDSATSLWYGTADAEGGPNGVNYFLRHPHFSMCPESAAQVPHGAGGGGSPYHSYDYGLYWGYLYAHDGGIQTIRLILQNIDAMYVQTTPDFCDRDVALAIDAALAARPGAHDSHAAAIVDFALALRSKEFSWATPDSAVETDWGAHLLEVKENDPGRWPVGAWGMGHVTLPPTGTHSVTATLDAWDVGDDWVVRVLQTHANGSLAITPLTAGLTQSVNTTGFDASIVQAVRRVALDSNVTVSVT